MRGVSSISAGLMGLSGLSLFEISRNMVSFVRTTTHEPRLHVSVATMSYLTRTTVRWDSNLAPERMTTAKHLFAFHASEYRRRPWR